MAIITRKCFISYHHADRDEVDAFVRLFDPERSAFIMREAGYEMAQDIIDSDDTGYVMQRVRELYLRDSVVTVVLLGRNTWTRRDIDWEIQASLRSAMAESPNGLLGIKLPSYPRQGSSFPCRLNLNLKQFDQQEDCYARWIEYPTNEDSLLEAIESAYQRRATHTKWINNPRDRMREDKQSIG